MKHRILVQMVFVAFFFSLINEANAEEMTDQDYQLVDKVCAVVEGEPPILLSEIITLTKNTNAGFDDAMNELIRDRLMWIYAKKHPEYSISQVKSAAKEHIAKVVEDNHLTREKFKQILASPPYLMSFRQYQRQTEEKILQNHMRSQLASKISIGDDQVREAWAKQQEQRAKKFDVAFITIKPSPINNKTKDALTIQKNLVNEIHAKIESGQDLYEIKKEYIDRDNISIGDPISYARGTLKKEYEKHLLLSPTARVTKPFEEGGVVVMIVRLKKKRELLDETTLEKVRKELYEKAVMEKFQAITDALKTNTTVMLKGCRQR